MTKGGDRTAQRQPQEALQTSLRTLRKIVESSLTAICIHRGNQVVYKNPAYDEFVGPLPGLFRLTEYSYIHPDDVETVRSFYKALLSGKNQAGDVEFRFYPPEGTGGRLGLKWVQCRGTRIEFKGEDALLLDLMDMTRMRELDNLMSSQDRMASPGSCSLCHYTRHTKRPVEPEHLRACLAEDIRT